MENLRDAIDYLVTLGEENSEPRVTVIDGKTYCNKSMKRYDQEVFASPLLAARLISLVDYIKNNSNELREKMIVQIVNPTNVKLLSALTEERDRECLFEVKANTTDFQFGNFYDQEDFVINLQASFVQSPETALLLSVAGNVENEATANYGDDGVSQKTTIKKGLSSKEVVKVPNPVTLAPYRTFLDVEQPESSFVFRIGESRDGAPIFKLVTADGGIWKYEAVANIKEYLLEQLKGMENIIIIG